MFTTQNVRERPTCVVGVIRFLARRRHEATLQLQVVAEIRSVGYDASRVKSQVRVRGLAAIDEPSEQGESYNHKCSSIHIPT